MQFDDIRITLYKILSLPENLGKYVTCEQICESFEKKFPIEWKILGEAYPVLKYGTSNSFYVSPYEPQKFVEAALKYYSMNNGIPGLELYKNPFVDKMFNRTINDNKVLLWKLSD